MNCPNCGAEVASDWIYCGHCGVNIAEYEKANEFIKRGLEFEEQFEYTKASQEYKKALAFNVPQDKILTYLERVGLKEQAIVDAIKKGDEFFDQCRWRDCVRSYEEVIKLNPRIGEELKGKLIHATSMLHKACRRKQIWAIVIIVIVSVVIAYFWRWMSSPGRVAERTLRSGAISEEIAERRATVEAMAGLKDKKYAPLLKYLLKDESDEVRAAAARALGEVGDTSAISVLKESLFDRSWRVRVEAAYGLVQLGDSSGIQLLREAIR